MPQILAEHRSMLYLLPVTNPIKVVFCGEMPLDPRPLPAKRGWRKIWSQALPGIGSLHQPVWLDSHASFELADMMLNEHLFAVNDCSFGYQGFSCELERELPDCIAVVIQPAKLLWANVKPLPKKCHISQMLAVQVLQKTSNTSSGIDLHTARFRQVWEETTQLVNGQPALAQPASSANPYKLHTSPNSNLHPLQLFVLRYIFSETSRLFASLHHTIVIGLNGAYVAPARQPGEPQFDLSLLLHAYDYPDEYLIEKLDEIGEHLKDYWKCSNIICRPNRKHDCVELLLGFENPLKHAQPQTYSIP